MRRKVSPATNLTQLDTQNFPNPNPLVILKIFFGMDVNYRCLLEIGQTDLNLDVNICLTRESHNARAVSARSAYFSQRFDKNKKRSCSNCQIWCRLLILYFKLFYVDFQPKLESVVRIR